MQTIAIFSSEWKGWIYNNNLNQLARQAMLSLKMAGEQHHDDLAQENGKLKRINLKNLVLFDLINIQEL